MSWLTHNCIDRCMPAVLMVSWEPFEVESHHICKFMGPFTVLAGIRTLKLCVGVELYMNNPKKVHSLQHTLKYYKHTLFWAVWDFSAKAEITDQLSPLPWWFHPPVSVLIGFVTIIVGFGASGLNFSFSYTSHMFIHLTKYMSVLFFSNLGKQSLLLF